VPKFEARTILVETRRVNTIDKVVDSLVNKQKRNLKLEVNFFW